MFLRSLGIFLLLICWPYQAVGSSSLLSNEALFQDKIKKIETTSGGRLGVAVFDTKTKVLLSYRGAERFPMASTFKALLAGALLKQSEQDDSLLQRRIQIQTTNLVPYSPVTEKHITDGMTVAELCAAAVQFSDNTAANLLMALLGGPQAVTEFAKRLGDASFRLDRWETELNTAIPGDERDTTTPDAMANSLYALVVGDVLAPQQREQMAAWLIGSTTGASRIRAGVPASWKVGDKTGGGAYGTTNDIAVLWPPQGAPMVLVVYFTQPVQDATPRNDVIVAATKIVCDFVLQGN